MKNEWGGVGGLKCWIWSLGASTKMLVLGDGLKYILGVSQQNRNDNCVWCRMPYGSGEKCIWATPALP